MVKASAGRPWTAQCENRSIPPPNRRPDYAQQRAEGDDGKRRDDRHRPLAGKESKVAQLEPVEAVEHRRGDQSHEDAAEDTGLDRRNAHQRRRLDAQELREGAHRREEDDIAHGPGERRHAVVVGEPDRDADGEEQRKVSKDRAAGGRHDLREGLGQPREVRAADAEENAGDGQHGDRQHHALADLLEERERVLEGAHVMTTFRPSSRTGLAPSEPRRYFEPASGAINGCCPLPSPSTPKPDRRYP